MGSPAGQRMRAIVQEEYGTADVLRVAEIERPSIGADEVLVKVRAAGLDRGTWHLMAGMPYAARLVVGLRAPKNPVPGLDTCGGEWQPLSFSPTFSLGSRRNLLLPSRSLLRRRPGSSYPRAIRVGGWTGHLERSRGAGVHGHMADRGVGVGMVVEIEWVVLGIDLQLEVVAGCLIVDGDGCPVFPLAPKQGRLVMVFLLVVHLPLYLLQCE